MEIEVTKYDTSDYLTDKETIINYLEETLKSNDIEVIKEAINNTIKSLKQLD